MLHEEPLDQAVDERGKPRDCGHEDRAPRTGHTCGLAECAQPVLECRQVIQRSEQQNRIRRGGRLVQGEGVTYCCGEGSVRLRQRVGTSLLDVQLDWVNKVDVVAVPGQPGCVHTRGPSDVHNPGTWRRQAPAQDLLRSRELEQTEAAEQPRGLPALLVVGTDLCVRPQPPGPASNFRPHLSLCFTHWYMHRPSGGTAS